MAFSSEVVLSYFNAADAQGEMSRNQGQGNTQGPTLKNDFKKPSSPNKHRKEEAEAQPLSSLSGIMNPIFHNFSDNGAFEIGPSIGIKPNVTISCPISDEVITIVDTGKGTFMVNNEEMSDAAAVIEIGLFYGRNKNAAKAPEPCSPLDISQDDPREELLRRLTMIIDQFEGSGFWVKESRVYFGYAENKPQTRLEFATHPGGPSVTVTDNGNGTVAIARTGSENISATSYERASALLGLFLGEHTNERCTSGLQRASQAGNRLMEVFEDAVQRGRTIAEQRRNAQTRAREAAFSRILATITGLFKDVSGAFTVQSFPDTHTIVITNRATQEKITVSANPDNTYRVVRGKKTADNASREDVIFDHLMPFSGLLPKISSTLRASAPAA